MLPTLFKAQKQNLNLLLIPFLNKPTYKKCFFLLLCIVFSCCVFSQTNSLIAPKLNTSGLANEKFIRSIFTGDFATIDFDRDEPGFSLILDAYIDAYWNKCGTSLPDDKVEITYQKCGRWVEHTTTGYFGTTVTKDCLDWDTIYTKVYTSPAMYEAKTTVDALQSTDYFRNMFRIIKQDNPTEVIGNYVQQAIILKLDMSSFFSMNDCKSAGMKRFEQNLYAFAMNKLPIVLEGSQIPRADPNVLLKDQDFSKLIDDLIYHQSKTWVINKYVPKSVTEENIVLKDGEGRPAKITANYEYMLGRQEIDGSVTLTFIDGLPNCLYFSDNPITCRTASRKIVLNYAMGKYVNILYIIDKTGTDWKVMFENAQYIQIHTGNEDSVKDFNVGAKSLVIIKPGQWLEYRTFDNKLGFPEWTMISEADRRSTADKIKSNQPDTTDNNIQAYTIDSTKSGYWIVKFHRKWLIRIQPKDGFYGGDSPHFSIILRPGEYVERENADDSYTLLKDLDRRNGDYPSYTVDKTKRPDLWTIRFNRPMEIRIQPGNKIFYTVQAGSGKQLLPGYYVEQKNPDGSSTILKDLDHR